MVNKTAEKYTPKLLVLCQLFYPEMISTGQTLTALCEALVDMGMDIKVICGPPTILNQRNSIPRRMGYYGMHIRRVWSTRFPKLNLFGRIVNQVTYAITVLLFLLFDTSKRPILVLTNPPFLALICTFFQIVRRRSYIYLIFDVYPETPINLGLISAKNFIARLWNRCNQLTYKRASKIIVIGRCMRNLIQNKINKKSKDKIHFIHIWSDDKRIQSAKGKDNPYIKKWGIEGKFVAIYSGNMGRFHDLETIMEAAKILKEKDNILFLFIGEGHKKQWMQNFTKKYELENCRFYSYVDRSDLGFSLSCADIGLVSLCENQEGLSVPSKAFGLMAAGIPIIAIMSSGSEISRLISEHRCGLVVKPGKADMLANSILNLYHNRSQLSEMSKNACKAVQSKYNLQAAADAYYEIIDQLNKRIYQ